MQLTAEQALNLLDRALQPGAALTRADYILCDQALLALKDALSRSAEDQAPSRERAEEAAELTA